MPLDVAMPVAHQINLGGAPYTDYYDPSGACFLRADAYFNVAGCAGIRLSAAPTAHARTPDHVWHLYAFTSGFLSFQSGHDLVLRLPRELVGRFAQFNSGMRFIDQRLT